MYQHAQVLSHDFIFMQNKELNTLSGLFGFNEGIIEKFLYELEQYGDSSRPEYWLMMARITEITLFCAGAYSDNCEFSAAGDLLVNPRRIVVRLKGEAVSKKRHGRISEQFKPQGLTKEKFMQWFNRNAVLETERLPLLPYMVQKMKQSGWLQEKHLDRVHNRMRKMANTIGFLSAWSISSAEDLQQRIKQASPELHEFIETNLCRFDMEIYERLGEDIYRLYEDPEYQSPFLEYQTNRISIYE